MLALLTLMSFWSWTIIFTKVILYKRTRRQVNQGYTLFNDAQDLAEALVTTAIGLVVAIPATIAYNYLLAMLGEVETERVNFAGAFLNRVEREVSWTSGSERGR